MSDELREFLTLFDVELKKQEVSLKELDLPDASFAVLSVRAALMNARIKVSEG